MSFSTARPRNIPLRESWGRVVPYIIVAAGIAVVLLARYADIKPPDKTITEPMWSTRDGWENL